MTARVRNPAYPWSEPPEGGAPREVAPGVFWVRMTLPFRLDHINLWMLADDSDWTVVDTGYAQDDETRRRWMRIFESGRRPSRVLVTHHHADHLGLAGWICGLFEAPLWITRAEWLNGHLRLRSPGAAQRAARDAHYRACGLGDAELAVLALRDGALARSIAAVPPAYRRLVDGQEITIGGRSWRVIVGEGHSPEHAALYCEEARVLLSGDQILPTISPHVGVWPDEPEANPLQLFLSSLERFLPLPEDTLVLPAHGLPFRGLHDRVRALLDHHAKRLEQTDDACKEWRTGAEIATLLFRANLDPHQLALALSESLAHLHRLRAAGRLHAELDGAGVRRFRRAG